MEIQGFNPYLPSWEYVPDGEPHLFEGRVYVYGSHDWFGGHVYCPGDYVCWSAPEDNLADWHYEGVIYGRKDDPENPDGEMCLYAPDVTKGPDGRYYLYYVLNYRNLVSVAVCDEPAGTYKFYGYVHYEDGIRLGEREGDPSCFDPGVMTEGNETFLYTGFCMADDKGQQGASLTVLDADMLTVKESPVAVIPNVLNGAGTGFEGHEFFEASSIRKVQDTYYLIYSSIKFHELCYATSQSPRGGFTFRGVLVSNADVHIDSYKPASQGMFYGGNNHGSIVEVNGAWYVFYHRHTNGTNYSRQGCLEPITIGADGFIKQAEMTSCGANGGPLKGRGTYPAYIACNLYAKEPCLYTAGPGDWMDCRFPKITQDIWSDSESPGFVSNMRDGATAGFKYFQIQQLKRIAVTIRGGCQGVFEVKTAWDGIPFAEIPVSNSNEWKSYSKDIGEGLPDGIHALYFTYRGSGAASLVSFQLE